MNAVLRSTLLVSAGAAAAFAPLPPSARAHGVRRPGALALSIAEPTTAAATVPTVLKEQRGNLAALDAEAMIESHGFPMSPDELIAKTKDFIAADYGADDTSMIAPDFTFVGPFVGPLTRAQYLDALGGDLNPSKGFPDLIGRVFGFTVDPVEPGRVWWVTRPTGTFTQPFFGADPDGRRIETPPQAMGVLFDASGQVRQINVGAVMDRTAGNSGGLGGLFGFLWFVGKAPPAPEYQPYQRSWQFALLAKVGPLLTKLQKQSEAKAGE